MLQEVFLSILRRGNRFDPTRGSVASWLLQMTYSKSLHRRKRRFLDSSRSQVALWEADQIAHSEPGPHRLTEVLSARKIVRWALMELSTDQRETLRMYFFEGYSLLEISRKRNETLGNTRHHYYRGIAALRSRLKSSEVSSLRHHARRLLSTDFSCRRLLFLSRSSHESLRSGNLIHKRS